MSSKSEFIWHIVSSHKHKLSVIDFVPVKVYKDVFKVHFTNFGKMKYMLMSEDLLLLLN
jgi:hypothetical protein